MKSNPLRNCAILAAFAVMGAAYRQSSLAEQPRELPATEEVRITIPDDLPLEVLGCECGTECDCGMGAACTCAETALADAQLAFNDATVSRITAIEQQLAAMQALASAPPVEDPRVAVLQTQVSDLNARLLEMEFAAVAATIPDISEPIVSTPEPTPADEEIFGRDYIDPPSDPAPTVYLNDANGYLTAAAIEAWIHDHYRQGNYNFQNATVDGNPWNHLMDGSGGDHTWRNWQISGLSDWEARALHDATHAGTITPRTRLESESFYEIESDSTAGLPIYWRNDRWEWEWDDKTYYSRQMWDGYEDPSGQFRYADGRMLVYQLVTADEPLLASAAPVVTRPQQSSVYYSGGGCANGNCGMPRRYRARAFGWRRR